MLKNTFLLAFLLIIITHVVAQTPSNDNCSNAFELIVGQEFIGSAIISNSSNCTPSGEWPNPTCSQFGNGEDIWFSVVVPTSGELTIETAYYNDLADTVLAVYEGDCGTLAEITCDDDSGTNYMSLAHVSDRVPGETLYIRMFDYQNNNFGSFLIAAYDSSLVNCEAPTNLDAFFLTENSALLFWDDNALNTSWEIQIIHQGDLPSSSGIPTNENSYYTTDLEYHVDYEFYVRAVCEDGGFSYWSNPFHFIIIFPENDGPSGAIPVNCGETVSGDTTYATIVEEVADCDEYPNPTTTSPGIWYGMIGDGSLIELSTCGQANFDTSIGVYTGDPGALICNSATDDTTGCSIYTTTHHFFSEEGELYYIRVYGYSETNIGQFNLSVSCFNSCVPPNNINTEVVDDNTAEVSWENGHLESSWNIEWGEVGFVLGEGNYTSDYNENTLTITGLSLYQAYEFYIQSNCEQGEIGDWDGPYLWNQAFHVTQMHEGLENLCQNTLFMDSGGLGHDYFNNEERVFIVYPTSTNQKIQVEFLEFNCGEEGDFLAIFNGEDDAAEMIVSSMEVGNEDMLNTYRATNEQGALTFIFDSNSENTYQGWKAVLSCYSTISVEENNLISFNTLPNPISTQLSVVSAENIQQYTLRSLMGQKILTGSPNQKNIIINLVDLTSGTYILEVWISGKRDFRKIIKN